MARGDVDVDFLPCDIIYLILLYLPVSSLLRLKSLSKYWLSLVESFDFVRQHFDFHQHDPKMDLLVMTRKCPFEKPQHVWTFSVDTPERHLPLDFPVVHDSYQITPVRIVGSVHGLICLQQGSRVCLWNPATKHCTNLPPLPVLTLDCEFGFGFDPEAGDYKVLTVNLMNIEHCVSDYVFHIYSLSSDSWRKFEAFTLPDMFVSSMKTLYRERIFCWVVSINPDQVDVVYAFDFSEEVFEGILAPGGIRVEAMFSLNENIACAGKLKNQDNEELYYEIWTLSDYQVKESWTKLYSIDFFARYITWMTWFSNNGEFLLILADKRLRLYDLLTQQAIDLPAGPDGEGDYYEVIECRESMLSIKRGDGAANGLASMDCNRRMLMDQPITTNYNWGDSDVHKVATFRILLWLPIVSLLRFKSVCKSWYSLIKSPDFVSQHLFLHHYQHNQDNLSLILHSHSIHYYPMFEDSSHHCVNASATCLLSSDKLELLDSPITETYFGLTIVTSFNGIICLRNSYNVCLWNPVTKQFRDFFLQNRDWAIGFGFDTKTNDYKMVIFCEGEDSLVQIYCLRTDSWRIMHDEILSTMIRIYYGLDAPYRGEFYCWLADIGDRRDFRVLLSFDFSNEVFRTMSLPDSINKPSLPVVLSVLTDNIVCISLGKNYYSDDDTDHWHCEIWMMSEYGVTESWVKLYMVGPFSMDWSFKMCYSKKNGNYMLLLKGGQLYEYDLVMQNTRRLPYQIQGPKDYQAVAYIESLVSIQ